MGASKDYKTVPCFNTGVSAAGTLPYVGDIYYPPAPLPLNMHVHTSAGINSTITNGTLSDNEIGGNISMNSEYIWRNLYEVYVVDAKGDIRISGSLVVASNEKGAEFEAQVDPMLRQADLTYDDVTIITKNLGQVKVKKSE